MKTLIPHYEILNAVQRIGKEISDRYPDGVVLIGVLKGSFMFLSDLMKNINIDTQLDFIQASSYEGTESTQSVTVTKDITLNINGQNVVLIEDIVDTGITLSHLLKMLESKHPKSLSICSLLHKPNRTIVNHDIDFLGFTIPDKFVVGYGLDYNQKYRNLTDIMEIV